MRIAGVNTSQILHQIAAEQHLFRFYPGDRVTAWYGPRLGAKYPLATPPKSMRNPP
jgi:hypothetical protein